MLLEPKRVILGKQLDDGMNQDYLTPKAWKALTFIPYRRPWSCSCGKIRVRWRKGLVRQASHDGRSVPNIRALLNDPMMASEYILMSHKYLSCFAADAHEWSASTWCLIARYTYTDSTQWAWWPVQLFPQPVRIPDREVKMELTTFDRDSGGMVGSPDRCSWLAAGPKKVAS